jgi:hypothetical protein
MGQKQKEKMSEFKFKPEKNIDEPSGFTNGDRAERALEHVKSHSQCMGDIEECNAQDLICDIFHLCDKNGWDIDEVLHMAKSDWRDER